MTQVEVPIKHPRMSIPPRKSAPATMKVDAASGRRIAGSRHRALKGDGDHQPTSHIGITSDGPIHNNRWARGIIGAITNLWVK